MYCAATHFVICSKQSSAGVRPMRECPKAAKVDRRIVRLLSLSFASGNLLHSCGQRQKDPKQQRLIDVLGGCSLSLSPALESLLRPRGQGQRDPKQEIFIQVLPPIGVLRGRSVCRLLRRIVCAGAAKSRETQGSKSQ